MIYLQAYLVVALISACIAWLSLFKNWCDDDIKMMRQSPLYYPTAIVLGGLTMGICWPYILYRGVTTQS